MKNKQFDCVEMKRKGAELVYQQIAALSKDQQLEYWRKESCELRKLMTRLRQDKTNTAAA